MAEISSNAPISPLAVTAPDWVVICGGVTSVTVAAGVSAWPWELLTRTQ